MTIYLVHFLDANEDKFVFHDVFKSPEEGAEALAMAKGIDASRITVGPAGQNGWRFIVQSGVGNIGLITSKNLGD